MYTFALWPTIKGVETIIHWYILNIDVVYVAKVTRLDNFHQETYTGEHARNFKGRLYAHNTNINNRHQTGTNLSKYVWKLKDNQPHSIPYEIEWGILGTDKPFNSVTGVCRLCLLEAYFFMFDEASSTLNTKDEYWSICVHKKYFLLDKVWIALLSLSLSRESFLPFLNPQI